MNGDYVRKYRNCLNGGDVTIAKNRVRLELADLPNITDNFSQVAMIGKQLSVNIDGAVFCPCINYIKAEGELENSVVIRYHSNYVVMLKLMLLDLRMKCKFQISSIPYIEALKVEFTGYKERLSDIEKSMKGKLNDNIAVGRELNVLSEMQFVHKNFAEEIGDLATILEECLGYKMPVRVALEEFSDKMSDTDFRRRLLFTAKTVKYAVNAISHIGLNVGISNSVDVVSYALGAKYKYNGLRLDYDIDAIDIDTVLGNILSASGGKTVKYADICTACQVYCFVESLEDKEVSNITNLVLGEITCLLFSNSQDRICSYLEV